MIITVPYLLEKGITLKENVDICVPLLSLRFTHGVELSEFRNIGLSLGQLLELGLTVAELKPHYTLQQFRDNNLEHVITI